MDIQTGRKLDLLGGVSFLSRDGRRLLRES